MPRKVGRKVFYLASGYLAVVVVALVSSLFLPSFEEVGHLERGCYWSDALVGFVRCEGFWGRGAVEYLLNLPLSLLYVPMFSVFEGAPWWLIPFAALLWAPILYFVWWTVRALQHRVSRT